MLASLWRLQFNPLYLVFVLSLSCLMMFVLLRKYRTVKDEGQQCTYYILGILYILVFGGQHNVDSDLEDLSRVSSMSHELETR